MPSTQLSVKLGMDNTIFKHDVPPKVRRSTFPFGTKRDFCLEAGAIVPIDCFETVPGDSFEIGCEYILKTLPLVCAPFTSYKVRTHWYYCRKIDLWKGAPTLTTKGRSGSISLAYPRIKVHSKHTQKLSEFSPSTTLDFYYDTVEGLSSYLGLPAGKLPTASEASWFGMSFSPVVLDNKYHPEYSFESVPNINEFYGGINALPFFMYQKIYRNSYVVPNLLQSNKVWFPDDISDGWRINYNKANFGDDSSSDEYSRGLFVPGSALPSFNSNNSSVVSMSPSVNDTAIDLLQLRYALFEDDRFTTALPWAQRGSAPTIDVSSSATIDDSDISISIAAGAIATDAEVRFLAGGDSNDLTVQTDASGVPAFGTNTSNASGVLGIPSIPSSPLTFTGSGLTPIPVNIQNLGFNLNQFRSLVALSVWQERNARTQGDYNSTVYAHFGVNPRHDDFEPRYIGGTSDVVNFGEVIQTSETGTTPQGHETGLGNLHSAGNVGFFRAEDFGYIMGVMIIQPETVYAQKIDRMWLRETVEDDFTPEDEGLGLQEIFKGEIFPSGNSSDKGLFGYQERNTEYKTRDNKAIGWFGLPPTVDAQFSAYAQSRLFNDQFQINHQFVVMSPVNMRRDFLAVPAMPMFKCTFASRIKAHRPMAYKTVPQTFGF